MTASANWSAARTTLAAAPPGLENAATTAVVTAHNLTLSRFDIDWASSFVTDPDAAIDNSHWVVGLLTPHSRGLYRASLAVSVAWDWDGFAQAQAHYA